MKAVRAFLFRLMNLIDRGRKDRELAEELESHLGMQIEDNLHAGMSPEQARREALLKSGGLETSKESCRDRRGLPLIETVSRDFAYALRQVRGSPGFAAVAVITLALGLTVNATIFFLINDLFLRPLPAADPGRLVMITQKAPQMGMMMFPFSYPDFLDFRRYVEGDGHEVPEMARTFSGVIAVTPMLTNLVVPGDMAPPANTGTDWRLFVFTFVASLATGILAGLLPALKATRLEILPLLKNAPAIVGTRHRLRSLLVIAQVAFSCLVLICAGLAARSVQKLSQINLGFRPDHINLVLRNGLKLAGIGLALGLLAALGLTQFLRGLLYGVSTFDPVSFAAVAAVLIGVAILACWWPARRAAKVDPVVALRSE